MCYCYWRSIGVATTEAEFVCLFVGWFVCELPSTGCSSNRRYSVYLFIISLLAVCSSLPFGSAFFMTKEVRASSSGRRLFPQQSAALKLDGLLCFH